MQDPESEQDNSESRVQQDAPVSIAEGSSLTSINQTGGQLAHSITNVNQPATFLVRIAFELGKRSMKPSGGRPIQTVDTVDTFIVKASNMGLAPCYVRDIYFCQEAGGGSKRLSVLLPSGPYRDHFDDLVYGHYCGSEHRQRYVATGTTGRFSYPVPFLCAELYRQGIRSFPGQILIVDDVGKEYMGVVPVSLQVELSACMALDRVANSENFVQEPRTRRWQPTFALVDFPHLSQLETD
jgi:hypothetical protein